MTVDSYKVHPFYRNIGAALRVCPGDLHFPGIDGYADHPQTADEVQAALDAGEITRYCWMLGPQYVVIDVDMHEGGGNGMQSFRQLCSDLEIDLLRECKATVQTPRDGLHLYFRVPAWMQGMRAIDVDRYPGIDTLGGLIKRSSLVIAAGSNHRMLPDVRYEFLESNPELVELPSKLAAMLAAAPKVRAEEDGVRSEHHGAPGDVFMRSRDGVKLVYELMSELGYVFRNCGEFLEFDRPNKTTGSLSGYLGKQSQDGVYQLVSFSLADEHFDSGQSITILEALRRLKGGRPMKELIPFLVANGFGGVGIDEVFVDETQVSQVGAMNWDFLLNEAGRSYTAVAAAFVRCVGGDLKYVPEWRKWLVWNQGRWRVDVDNVLIERHIHQFVIGAFAVLAEWTRTERVTGNLLKTVRSFVRGLNSAAGIRQIAQIARVHEKVVVGVEELNTHQTLLNVRNGTICLQTGELREHRRADLMTQLAGVDFDAAAECPKWIETLEIMLRGDLEMVAYVQKLLGYSLSGSAGESILPIAQGDGNNGKSTLWGTVVGILGDYAMLAGERLLMDHGKQDHPTSVASLYQKRIVAISEPEKGCRLNESRVKELTGESVISARRMREDEWSFRRTHTFWMSTNHMPAIRGTDQGIWRRIKLIPMTVDMRTAVKEVIPGYVDWLIEHEGPGILRWLLEGSTAYWADKKLVEPELVRRATAEYRAEQDMIGRFIDEDFEVNPKWGLLEGEQLAEWMVPCQELKRVYKYWSGGLHPPREIDHELQRWGIKRVKCQIRNTPHMDKWVYVGIRIAGEGGDFSL